jgi:hypothetical protein
MPVSRKANPRLFVVGQIHGSLESPQPSGQPGDLTRGGAAPLHLQQAGEQPVVAEPRPRRV